MDVKIQGTNTNTKTATKQRVAPHSHIRGLGLEQDGRATEVAAGFIGQSSAREAAGLVVDLVKSRRMSGRAVLIAGPSGTGKTAIALAMSQELGAKVPFCPIVASEVFSAEVKKTEVLAECVRKSIGVRVKEIKEVYEGEVVELNVHESSSSAAAASDHRAISHLTIILKASKGTKTLKLDPSIYDAIRKAKVRVGDVIFIESNSGAVKRLGRSDAFRAEYDLEAEEYVPLPKGEVHKKREVIQEVTLHDLDVANARPQAGDDVVALVGSMLRPKKSEMTEKLRSEINKVVNNYIEQGTAELVPGILFIDEAHMLDLECFAYLNRIIESTVAPILVLATNRMGTFLVRGSDVQSSHGIPRDLLDRLLIIRTGAYDRHQLHSILSVRAKTERINIAKDALDKLADIGNNTSLRYAAQLLTPSSICAVARSCENTAQLADVEEAYKLFLDARRSAAALSSPDALNYL